ncbi:redoxin domain-containing protein [Beggiatoa leptomitoformis]|uniref:Redoxin domain-containing protein n=2 Tax=Beggiatoa leptomitoformis TaxID=288004 RepID=A0A2N9YJK4_9GAMM|nr:redoxin domain-containing protein [Beggiatoa leptomitoformis]AUI70659.2 redoxin domain-containing protein [Beggiatoa leptomitoformis]
MSLETSEDDHVNLLLRTARAETATQRPDFSLPDLQGKQRKNSEWDGKVVILNFWATWCPPCIQEIPMFMHLQRTYAEQGLQIVGIAIDEAEAVTEFNTSLKMNYPILLGEEAGVNLSKSLGNNIGALPFTVFIDPQGNIITRHIGELDEEQTLKILRPFLTSKTTRPSTSVPAQLL